MWFYQEVDEPEAPQPVEVVSISKYILINYIGLMSL